MRRLSFGLLRLLGHPSMLRPPTGARGTGSQAAQVPPDHDARDLDAAFVLDEHRHTPAWLFAARLAGYDPVEWLARYLDAREPHQVRDELALDQLGALAEGGALDPSGEDVTEDVLRWELHRVALLPLAYPDLVPYQRLARSAGLTGLDLAQIRDRTSFDGALPVCAHHKLGRPPVCNDNGQHLYDDLDITVDVVEASASGPVEPLDPSVSPEQRVMMVLDPATWPEALDDFWAAVDVPVEIDRLPAYLAAVAAGHIDPGGDALVVSKEYEILEHVVIPGSAEALPPVRLKVYSDASEQGFHVISYVAMAGTDVVVVDEGFVIVERICADQPEYAIDVVKALAFREGRTGPLFDTAWQTICQAGWVDYQKRFVEMA